jgi:glycerophosphoryl diester phosphodiesterase
MNLHRGYLARIKHKCLITILSLLELCDSRHGIAIRVKRTIPIHIIVENLIDLYEKYRNLNQDKYSMQSFEYLNAKIVRDAAPKD